MKATIKRKKSIFWFGILLLLFLIALNFITDELKYFGLDEVDFGRYWDIKWWLIGHLLGGIAALILGPFQFWTEFRNKYLRLHRLMGKVYLIAILIASFSSVYMAWTHAIEIHLAWAVALQTLGLVWFCTIFMAYRAIRKRIIEQHKEWMIRSYVVTFAFVAFRWLNNLPAVIELGSFAERAPTIVWLVWVIPLFITEIILQWNRK